MNEVLERFLRYVSYDTQSADGMEQVPSTAKQLVLASLLAEELKAMGAARVSLSEHGYVFAAIPATLETPGQPVLGFIAHMDTSPDLSGKNVKPRFVENYDGGDMVLNKEKNIILKVSEFPFMKECEGTDLIVTDGTTLLGADDKA